MNNKHLENEINKIIPCTVKIKTKDYLEIN